MRNTKNIYRYEHHYFTGWVVRATRRSIRGAVLDVESDHYVKYFADPDGDSAVSLRAAMAYRDRLVDRLPFPFRVKRRNKLNRTGVIGVALTRERTRRGRILRRYAAYWPETYGGRPKKKTFSLAKYGAAEAKRLAIAARKKGLKQLFADAMRQRR